MRVGANGVESRRQVVGNRRAAGGADLEVVRLPLRLDGRRVLVAGGGGVATRRVPGLLDAGADVLVVSPQISASLHDLAAALNALPDESDAETIQNVIYEVGKRHPFPELKAWFACLYQVLLGQEEGPRFGGFIALYGVAETIALIESKLTVPADAA